MLLLRLAPSSLFMRKTFWYWDAAGIFVKSASIASVPDGLFGTRITMLVPLIRDPCDGDVFERILVRCSVDFVATYRAFPEQEKASTFRNLLEAVLR